MEPSPIFRGTIKNGKVCIADSMMDAFTVYKESLEGKAVEIIIRPMQRKPSPEKHRFYRGVLLPIFAESMGQTTDEMHKQLTAMLCPIDVERPHLGGRSTAHLTDSEYGEFIEGVYAKAAFAGIRLPEPGEMEPR